MAPAIAALPLVKSMQQCADFQRTVLPYLPQLQQLPEKFVNSISSGQELKALYLDTNPVVTAIAFVIIVSPLFLVASEINRNYSQVDRFWSLLPTVFIAHYVTWAHLAGLPCKRMDNVLGFSFLWTLRLTFNYWRRGGYSIGSEDYRWEIVRKQVNAPIFFVFNVVFISFLQIVLLFFITTPAYLLLLASSVLPDELNNADYAFSGGLILLIAIEYLADQQQWDYHQAKALYQKSAKVPPGYKREDLDRGFCTSGLWSVSRHPNFAAEQTIWFVLYQWGCYATFSYLNWTIAGAMSYLFLFQGSTWLTERISAGKYPDYAQYQRRVSKFFPKLATAFTGPVPSSKAKAIEAEEPSKPVTRSAAKSKRKSVKA